MTTNEKIEQLRKQMIVENVDIVIIPSADPHQSEYLAEHWQDRAWISGFTGSAGLVVITQHHAGLWTDSRYFIQAETELAGSEMVLHKLVNQFEPEHLIWLKDNVGSGSVVAVDPSDFSVSQMRSMHTFFDKAGYSVKYVDLVSRIWTDRPALPKGAIEILTEDQVGEHFVVKLDKVRSKMTTDILILSGLDEIAYLFNIRGTDVAYNPVVVAFGVVTPTEVLLFVDKDRENTEFMSYFQQHSIVVRPYADILDFVKSLHPSTTVSIDPTVFNFQLYNVCEAQVVEQDSIIKHLKAIKNAVEIEHTKKAMELDGVALAKAFYWLEKVLENGSSVTEYEFAAKIAEMRHQHDAYRGESFAAIIGYNANGAIIHYKPEKDSATIKSEGILLCDSGGQYTYGTTDITRTIALGTNIDPEVIERYTEVLKGNLAVARCIFPKGTSGSQIDILARQFLWQSGKNYLHGTGHGVGFYLNVHEGPQGIGAPTTERGRTPLKIGMITSNEPGYYEKGNYGIRIENLILVVSHETYPDFYRFDELTLYPYDSRLINKERLTADEVAHINQYHEMVYKRIVPYLSSELAIWFKSLCQKI